jgi:hypothetical protein
MQKRPVQAISYDQFLKYGPRGPQQGMPPPPHETLLERLFTAVAYSTGLTRHARRQLVRRIERFEGGRDDLNVAQRVQHLYAQLNTVVDGGWMGLWTSIRVSVGVA